MEISLENLKTLEITSIIDSGVIYGEITPKQYFRAASALRSIRDTAAWDFIAAAECSIEMYAGNTKKAFTVARTLLESTNIRFVAHAYFIFINTTAFLLANKTIERIVNLCDKQKIPFEKNLPLDFIPITFLLTGRLHKLQSMNFKSDGLNREQINEFEIINNALNISDFKLKEVGAIIFNTFMDENIRCRRFEHNFFEGELLILLHVQAAYSQIQRLNSLIFNKCYDSNLSEELRKLSYYIVPYKNEVDINEHI